MIYRYSITILVVFFLFAISCNDYMKSCFLRVYPVILLVSFDSTEIDTIQLDKFDSRYNFDSIINSKKIAILNSSFHKLKDSFLITPFMYSDTHVNYDASSRYNFEIKFGNNRSVKIKNITYDNNECDSYGAKINAACYCDYLGCYVITNNCNYKVINKGIYVTP